MSGCEAKKNAKDMKETKQVLADMLRQVRLIDETYTGEVTIGLNNGGVMFIRKSETLK